MVWYPMSDLAALLVQIADRAVEQVCRYAVIGSATLKSRQTRGDSGCPSQAKSGGRLGFGQGENLAWRRSYLVLKAEV